MLGINDIEDEEGKVKKRT